MNNAVNTNLKEGTDVLTGIAIVAFKNLCCLTVFQSYFLSFLTFDMMLEKHVCLTQSCELTSSQTFSFIGNDGA